MCNADMGLVSHVWARLKSGEVSPQSDFVNWHRCRNYDAVLEWAFDHERPEGDPDYQGVLLPGDRIVDTF